jgi:hypothetical protein
MMDRRQPDDVSARERLPPTGNLKSSIIHRYVWLTLDKPLDSRIATIANHARGAWAGSGTACIESMSEEFPVADIVVQCPRTGTPVPTGLKTEWVFLRSLPRVAIPLRCPACGQTHKWQPHEAWIAPTLQASAANSAAETVSAEASQR